MTHRHFRLAAILCALAGTALTIAGPIDPPAGPVQSTMKTLDQVEARTPINAQTCPGDADSVFRIYAPGSYYLTGNLQGASGFCGIEIAASNVTVDLGGFTLIGGSGSLSAVFGTSDTHDISVSNGSVEGWGSDGIALGATTAPRVSNISAHTNGRDGVNVGPNAIVAECRTSTNSRWGIFAADKSTLRDSTSRGNGTGGIYAAPNSIIRSCTAAENDGTGIYATTATTVETCSATQNVGNGFTTSGHGLVLNSVAFDNQGNGFQGSDNSRIVGCSASSSGGVGIKVSWGGVVIDCISDNNTSHGIEAGAWSRVTGSYCRSNGSGAGAGAGVYLPSSASRVHVENNTCDGNDRGIQVDGTFNLIFANTCTSNSSNFEIVSNNRVGTIVVLPMSGAISGNSGGSSAGADPVSNFAF